MTDKTLMAILRLALASAQTVSFRPSRDHIGAAPVPMEVLASQRKGTIRGHSKEGVTQPSPAGHAQITAERAPVYRAASADQGSPVTVLQKGDDVWIDFVPYSPETCSTIDTHGMQAVA